MKFDTSVPLDNGLWANVEAEILFDLAPHVASVATFMLHLDPSSLFGRWNVSSVETGLWVAHGDSRREALKKARDRLAKKTDQDFLRAYRKAFKLNKQLDGGKS